MPLQLALETIELSQGSDEPDEEFAQRRADWDARFWHTNHGC